MNVTSEIARITRALHAGSVNLHILALRGVVAGAARRTRLSHASMDRAEALANTTINLYRASTDRYNHRRIEQMLTTDAARIEAKAVGGTL